MESHISQGWFEVWEIEPGVHVIQEPFHVENVKSYLVVGNRRAILIDTGMGVGDIRSVAESLTDLPVTVLNSHSHWDHIGGNWQFDNILIHRAEAKELQHPPGPERIAKWFQPEQLTGPLPSGVEPHRVEIRATTANLLLDGGETIDLGGRVLEVIHAPGHSPGGIVVVDRDNGIMFSTDVAYLTRLYAYSDDSDVYAYRETLSRLETIAEQMRVLLPSHDRTPVDPAVIAEMRAAFDRIITGREPDEIDGERAIHDFGVFGVMVPADFKATGVRE